MIAFSRYIKDTIISTSNNKKAPFFEYLLNVKTTVSTCHKFSLIFITILKEKV